MLNEIAHVLVVLLSIIGGAGWVVYLVARVRDNARLMNVGLAFMLVHCFGLFAALLPLI